MVNIPRLLAGLPDFEIVEDADAIGRQAVEDLTNDLLSEKAETVIGVAQENSG